MQSCSINFTNPWLLFLIIPALAVVLIPFFLINKRYRYNRNRVTSVVLHILVMMFATLLVAGVTFNYDIPNTSNQLILLVDVSSSQDEASKTRDDFVETVLYSIQDSNVQVGIVTFGYTAQEVVPLTTITPDNYDLMLSDYLAADKPDVTATNIASALRFTKDLFTNPQSSKVLLVTDGKETDEEAIAEVSALASQGTKIDVANVNSDYAGDDFQITGVSYPDNHIFVGDQIDVTVHIKSTITEKVTLNLTDNGKLITTLRDVSLIEGDNIVKIPHIFETSDLHRIEVQVESEFDTLAQNNTYHSYYYLQLFNKVLVLESFADSSTEIENMLTLGLEESEKYDVEIMDVAEAIESFTEVDQLRAYHQIILNNVSYADMTPNFIELIDTYVSKYGGGLLTVGGNNESGETHMYNKEDLYNTSYEEMLPVRAVDYTPPVGVFFVIDTSGSMSSKLGDGTEDSRLDWARSSVTSCLNVLNNRDYMGIITFSNEETPLLPLTPVSQKQQIRNAITTIDEASGGTVAHGAIMLAESLLASADYVAKRHIVVITDGQISTGEPEVLKETVRSGYEKNGTTITIAALSMSQGSNYGGLLDVLQRLGNGYAEDDLTVSAHYLANAEDVIRTIREEVVTARISGSKQEDFIPRVLNPLSNLVTDLTFDEKTTLGGYFGTQAKSSADVILVGEYNVPIYAQWSYGKGMVGSFMCDLSGEWSSTFIGSDVGTTFIRNVVGNLMPIEDITPNPLRVELRENNYTNTLSIFGNLSQNERIEGTVTYLTDGIEQFISLNEVTDLTDVDTSLLPIYVTTALTSENSYSRAGIVIRQGGLYIIDIVRYDETGMPIEEVTIYKNFAYSAEYDRYLVTEEQRLNLLTSITVGSEGVMIEALDDPQEVLEGFITVIHKQWDPRILLAILILVLFLLEVAVRKFKFKWPHELIRGKKK